MREVSMEGVARIIYEVIPSEGVDPEIQVDTDELSPPTYADIAKKGEDTFTVAPGETDTVITLPRAACLMVLVSDEPILVRLAAGEKQLRVRLLLIGAEDETGEAIDAASLRVSGNGVTTATVRLHHLGRVT